MFIAEMFMEENGPRIIVTYPGRFQPFHKGHAAVFHSLQAKFGRDSVYILTSNKTDGAKSPFNFSDKVQLMTAAGIPQDRIIETNNVYELPEGIDRTNTIFITAVGAPDADRLQPDGVYKRDNPKKGVRAGDETYFKTWKGTAEAATADRHGYVIIVPEVRASITIAGKTYDASHGTDCRNLWNQVRGDERARAEYIKQLYGRADPAIGVILDKIPSPVAEAAGVGVVASNARMARDPRYSMSLTKDVRPDTPMKNARALHLIERINMLKEQLQKMRVRHGS
jgi:hypothetical protein